MENNEIMATSEGIAEVAETVVTSSDSGLKGLGAGVLVVGAVVGICKLVSLAKKKIKTKKEKQTTEANVQTDEVVDDNTVEDDD